MAVRALCLFFKQFLDDTSWPNLLITAIVSDNICLDLSGEADRGGRLTTRPRVALPAC